MGKDRTIVPLKDFHENADIELLEWKKWKARAEQAEAINVEKDKYIDAHNDTIQELKEEVKSLFDDNFRLIEEKCELMAEVEKAFNAGWEVGFRYGDDNLLEFPNSRKEEFEEWMSKR